MQVNHKNVNVAYIDIVRMLVTEYDWIVQFEWTTV